MKIYATYSVKIKNYNRIFSETVSIYREAVNFLMDICLSEWSEISVRKGNQAQIKIYRNHTWEGLSVCKYDADTIVFEHLELGGKKRGSKK